MKKTKSHKLFNTVIIIIAIVIFILALTVFLAPIYWAFTLSPWYLALICITWFPAILLAVIAFSIITALDL